jgi:flagellin
MNVQTNVASAESVIRHADFSKETMHLTRQQVLSQSSTAMLSQANSLPGNILSLLNNI